MSRDVMDDLAENPAVQAGGVTLLAAGTGSLASSIGVTSAAQAGLILASLGPIGWVAGGILLFGGVAYTISNRK